jgi:hypothetical protein
LRYVLRFVYTSDAAGTRVSAAGFLRSQATEGVIAIGLLLVLVGLLLWLLAGWQLVGLILFVVGLVLLFVPGAPYGLR